MALERQAITATTLARIPRRPGPGAVAVRCQGRNGTCRQVVAVIDGDFVFIRHNGGEWVGMLPGEAKCPRCGHHTRLDSVAVMA